MKVLCVAEKPSISKAVAQTLSGGAARTRKSRAKYIMNYDFEYTFSGQRCAVTMTSVLGHLTNVDFPPAYAWGKCAPGRLLEAPVVEVVSQRDVYDNIAREARGCDALMIWTDCDREGEFIGWEILQAARQGNAALREDAVWRAQFSHLERAHVVAAAQAPSRLDMNAVRAVATRMELDLRVGASFTRLLTDLFRGSGAAGVVSYGTCQFPTLGFVVDRYLRVKSFVAEPFWSIAVEVASPEASPAAAGGAGGGAASAAASAAPPPTVFTWTKHHLFDRLLVTLLYQQCFGATPTITSVTRKPTTNYRPLPLTTVELQKDCARLFRMSAKDALDAAEKLYNKGFVSYPRTETDRFPAAMDLRALVQHQAGDAAWGAYAARLLASDFRHPRQGRRDDKAHPPIHPVAYVAAAALDNDRQRKVYEYVVRRFLACCSDDARGELNAVQLTWGRQQFAASGLAVLARNYLDVYPYRTWSSSQALPPFREGQAVVLHSAKVKEGRTSAPSHMTEPELIGLMDANGIGTDATIAEHIHKVIARGYVVRLKQRGAEYIVPSELGMGLIRGFDRIEFDNISLSKPFLRKRLEGELQDIADGKTTKEAVLRDIVALYRSAFVQSASRAAVLVAACREVARAGAA
ncbi:DNA topoisomerase [[Candida] zeylanoides]